VGVAEQRSYELTVTFGDALYELEESNDLRATAQVLTSADTYSGHDSNWAAGAENDWYRVTVPSGVTTIEVELTDIGSGVSSGTSCTLFDGAEAQVAQVIAMPSATVDQAIGVAAGQYFLRVSVAEGRAYTLNVTF
jgi:hypothetical protein